MKKQSSTATAKKEQTIESKPKSFGIVLIAMCNPYYIHMAYNMCLSLKAQNRNVLVTLVTDSIYDHLFDIQKFVFDRVVKMEDVNPFQVKTSLYELSMYDKTLYLDADMIWNPAKSLDEMVAELSGTPFTMANRGVVADSYDWADAAQFRKATGIESLYNLSSEFIYFEKSDEVKELFDLAKTFYSDNKHINRRLGGYQPDEPSFAYAMWVAKLQPHKIPFYPAYWQGNFPGVFAKHTDIQSKYSLISMGGAYTDKHIVNLYNRYALIAGDKMGCQPFEYKQKRTLVRERATA